MLETKSTKKSPSTCWQQLQLIVHNDKCQVPWKKVLEKSHSKWWIWISNPSQLYRWFAHCLLHSWKDRSFISNIKLTQRNEQLGHDGYISCLFGACFGSGWNCSDELTFSSCLPKLVHALQHLRSFSSKLHKDWDLNVTWEISEGPHSCNWSQISKKSPLSSQSHTE